jgi:hypothetical protein
LHGACAVEGFFAKLTKRRLKRGVFRSVADLQAAINRFLEEHNGEPKPFTRTANPDKTIAAVSAGIKRWSQSTSATSKAGARAFDLPNKATLVGSSLVGVGAVNVLAEGDIDLAAATDATTTALLIDQAERQVIGAGGAPIEWHVANEFL